MNTKVEWDKKTVEGLDYTCSKCGMVFKGITSYYCPQDKCPTFIKVSL